MKQFAFSATIYDGNVFINVKENTKFRRQVKSQIQANPCVLNIDGWCVPRIPPKIYIYGHNV